ncbi:MAG: hypothetical protein HKL84_02045 [Acidimicrobiaceae bacterium]|nr:hypothetical protein [Acidimicrobiaceae bacterium]
MSMPFIVEIKGPGHHERSEYAGSVVKIISGLGKVVAVEADLRPRLAGDLAEMLELGAREVLLYAKGMMAKVVLGPEVASRLDLEALHDSEIEVIVRLVPGDGTVRAVFPPTQDALSLAAISQALIDNQINVEITR